jgi:hypothetical protein
MDRCKEDTIAVYDWLFGGGRREWRGRKGQSLSDKDPELLVPSPKVDGTDRRGMGSTVRLRERLGSRDEQNVEQSGGEFRYRFGRRRSGKIVVAARIVRRKIFPPPVPGTVTSLSTAASA